MQFSVGVPTDRTFADPAALVSLAVEAEEAGWDGFFVWDHLVRRQPWQPLLDPWVVLGAVAQATSTIRIGTMVTPVPRRRPWKLARETATLDRLSGGRLILGVGIGAPDDEFTRFGEDADLRVRADKLDEGLEILAGLWSGQPFSYAGEHHVVDDVTFTPTPVQQPRIPIWVAGGWPSKRPFRRAARWDGVFPMLRDARGGMVDLATADDIVTYTLDHRREAGLAVDGYDVAIHAITPEGSAADAARLARSYADAGVTWWSELLERPDADLAAMRERVLQGPPR